MAAATPSVETAMAQWREMFADATFGREVQLWMERADPQQRQQVERTFAKLNTEFQQMAKAAAPGSGPGSAPGPSARSAALPAAAAALPARPAAVPSPTGGKAAAATSPKVMLPPALSLAPPLAQPPSAKQPPSPSSTCHLPLLGSPKPSSSAGGAGGWGYTSTVKTQTTRLQTAAAAAADKPRPTTEERAAAAARAEELVQSQRSISAPHDRPIDAAHHNPFTSTYRATFCAQEDDPELFKKVDALMKQGQLPRAAAEAQMGNPLNGLEDEESRKMFMKSMYTMANEEVIKEDTHFEVVKEQAYFDNFMTVQKTYYGDLLLKMPQEALEKIFNEASMEEKHEILESLRQVYVVAQPEAFKSHSQTVHCEMRNPEDPGLTQLVSELTRIKMGYGSTLTQQVQQALEATEAAARAGATGPESSSCRPPATAPKALDLSFPAATASPAAQGSPAGGSSGGAAPHTPTSAGAGTWGTFLSALSPSQDTPLLLPVPGPARKPGGAPGPSGRGLDELPESMRPLTSLAQKQTAALNGTSGTALSTARMAKSKRKKTVDPQAMRRSSVPLSWPGSLPVNTTYKESFPVPCAGGIERPAKADPTMFTSCPAGALNMRLAASQLRASYPLPERFIHKPTFPPSLDDATDYRHNFCPRDADATQRSLREAAFNHRATKEASGRVTLPLGPENGYNLVPPKDWRSEVQNTYVPHIVDAKAYREKAEATKAMHHRPTCSVGTMAGLPAADA